MPIGGLQQTGAEPGRFTPGALRACGVAKADAPEIRRIGLKRLPSILHLYRIGALYVAGVPDVLLLKFFIAAYLNLICGLELSAIRMVEYPRKARGRDIDRDRILQIFATQMRTR